ncbi:MAG: beta-N-acetylhexosaminidase [Lachnospiraceae bacterium]|nr:beta-N-acetylhexosaminidase [Lachnospiraceae bacterium]
MILLPVPKKVTEENGKPFRIGLYTMIVMDGSCPKEGRVYAQMLQEEIEAATGRRVPVSSGAARRGDILLKVVSAGKNDLLLDGAKKEGSEASICCAQPTSETMAAGNHETYTLCVNAEQIVICGSTLRAMGWGVQTLRQIVRQKAGLISPISVEDWPDLPNRGFYHDVTRGRVQKLDELKKMADIMALYKMTELQLYIEHTYLFRDCTEMWRDETPLTAEEIMELDDYCYARGIELVPSIASFGHLFKLLNTKTYHEFCEIQELPYDGFSWGYRMDHHTMNVSNPGSIELAKSLILEFMQLVRSKKFNICADETFDLGKGESGQLAEEKGAGQLYVDYIKELFDFLEEHGCTPMFWGDIITHYPELLQTLPKNIICLNWGYGEKQGGYESRVLSEAGATQYLCPGVRGWNTWINFIWESYENILRMRRYARTYGAIGVLNTDWGDYGHINHPEFSMIGLIYGAIFSWGDTDMGFEEMSRQISILHYGDRSGKLIGCLNAASRCSIFDWYRAVIGREWPVNGKGEEALRESFQSIPFERVPRMEERIAQLRDELCEISRSMNPGGRRIIHLADQSLDMMSIWNRVGAYLYGKDAGEGREKDPKTGKALAVELERSLHAYQQTWRENSKEGDLPRITALFSWYADQLRG